MAEEERGPPGPRKPEQKQEGYSSFLSKLDNLGVAPKALPKTTLGRRYQTPQTTQQLTATPAKVTGIDLLDKNLAGGLPAGSMVFFSADPRSMSEVFLYQFSTTRKTFYFATSRRPSYIMQNITDLNFDTHKITFIDIYSQYYLDQYGEMIDNVGNEYVDREIVDFTEKQVRSIRETAANEDINIIFDSFSFFLELNTNFGKVLRLANLVYETTKATGALTYLYVLRGSHPDKVQNELMNVCDTVFDVEVERMGEKITNKLSIPKLRGRIATGDLIRFKVADGVQIDTSRDIA